MLNHTLELLRSSAEKATLKEFLTAQRECRLREMAEMHSIQTQPTTCKTKLVENLQAKLLDLRHFRNCFLGLTPEEIDLFDRLVRETVVPFDDTLHSASRYFCYSGFLELREVEGTKYLLVYPELVLLYSVINTEEFRADLRLHQNVDRYVRAATSLYGAVHLGQFFEIYNAHNRPISLYDVDRISAHLELSFKPYFLHKDYFLHDSFRDGLSDPDGRLSRWLTATEGIRNYFSPTVDFLKYVDAEYVEETLQFLAVQDFLVDHVTGDISKANALTKRLYFKCAADSSLSDILKELERSKVTISPKVLSGFVPLLVEMDCSARKWRYKGFTYNELHQRGTGLATHRFYVELREKAGKLEGDLRL